MTTDIILTGAATVVGWVAVLAGTMLISDDLSPAAIVMFPDADFMNALPVDVAILSHNAVSVTLISDMPGFGKALYQAGALIVLPAGLEACAPVRK